MPLRSSFFFGLVLACLSATGLFSAEPSWETKSGPWGDLQVRAVYLEPPDNILAVVSKPSSVTRWTFEQTTEKGVRAIMAKAGLPATLIDRLMGPTQVVTNGNNLVVLPKVEDLLEIGEAPRSALYAELAKFSANEYHRDPVFIHGGDIDDWLSETEITKPQQELIRKLLWRRGSAVVFSDIQALLTLTKSPEEVAMVFRTITRVRSLLVELKLPLKESRAGFIQYWSAGSLNTERVPFLSAITRRRAPQMVDITQFLPTLARRRVYTFPTAAMGLKGHPLIEDIRTMGLVAAIDMKPVDGTPGLRAYKAMENGFHDHDIVLRITGDTIALLSQPTSTDGAGSKHAWHTGWVFQQPLRSPGVSRS